MPNTLGGLSLTAIAAEALPVLQKRLAQFNIYTTDFSSDVAQVGSAVSTRYVTPATASVYSNSTGYATTDQTSTAVTVTLGNHIHTTVGFTDAEIGNISLPKLQQTFIAPLVNSTINSIADQIGSLVTIGNFAVNAFSGSGAGFTYSNFTTGSVVLQKSGSSDNVSAVLNPVLYQALKVDLKNTFGLAVDTVRSGDAGIIDGKTTQLDARLGSQGQGLAGFLCGKDAICIASRVPASPIPAYVEVENLTDPNSGFTVQLRQWYSADRGQWMLSAIAIFGVQKGNPGSLVRFVDTGNP